MGQMYLHAGVVLCLCALFWTVPETMCSESTLLIKRLQQRAVFKILNHYPNPRPPLSSHLCGPRRESSNDTSWLAAVQTAGYWGWLRAPPSSTASYTSHCAQLDRNQTLMLFVVPALNTSSMSLWRRKRQWHVQSECDDGALPSGSLLVN